MDALRSLKLASICLAFALVCLLIVQCTGYDLGDLLLVMFCVMPATYGWPIAAGVGTLVGAWSIVRAIQTFERRNSTELVVLLCVLVTLGNGAMAVGWLWGLLFS